MKDLSRTLYKSKSLKHFTNDSMIDTINSQRDLNASFFQEKLKQKDKAIKQQQKRELLRKLLAKKFRLIYNVIRLLHHHERVILDKHEEMKKKSNYIILPNDKIKRFWDFVMLFIYLETALYLPLRISFIQIQELDIINDIIFGINIIFILRSSYLNRQNLQIQEQWLIIKNYLKGWLILDIITLIPIDEILGWSVPYQKFPRFLRVFSINTILRGSLFYKQNTQTLLNTYQINIMRIIVKFIYGLHLFTCLWYLVEQLNNTYINCLFWALQTFSTIGYGNDDSKNQPQYLVAIIWMFLGASFYGVVLLNLGEWLKKLDSDSIHIEMQNNLKDFFQKIYIIDEVKHQIHQYISLNIRQNQTWSLGLQDWFQDLPIQRQKDITLFISYKEMMDIHFFRLNLNFSVQILPKMMFMKIEQNSKLFLKNECVNEIFFLMKGRVQYRTQFGKTLLIIEEGSIIGEQEYFKNGKLNKLKYRQNYAITMENCQFIVLDGEFFLDQLSCFPQLLNYLGMIAQQREYLMKMQIIQNKFERERERINELRLQQIKETYQIDVQQYEGIIKPQKSVIYDTQQTRTQQILEQLLQNRRSKINKLFFQFRKVVQMIIFANRLILQQSTKIHPFIQQQSCTTFKTTESRGQKSIEKSIIMKQIHTQQRKKTSKWKIRISKNKRVLDWMFKIKNDQSFVDSVIENDDFQNYQSKLQQVITNCIEFKQKKKMIIQLQRFLNRQKEELEDDLINVSNWIGNLELKK